MKRYCFTAEITLVVDSSGTTQTFYFATEGFATKAADTPSNKVFRELLTDPGSIRRELFSGARVTGENRPSFGQLVLINANGVLDDWMSYGVSGAKVVVRYGEPGAAYPSAFTTVYIAYAYSLIVDFNEVRVLVRDRLYLLDRPVVQDIFNGTGNLEGTGIATGTKQVVFGRPGYIPMRLIDQNRQIYFVHANATDERAFIVAGQRYLVYDGGVPLTFQSYSVSEADFLATSPDAGNFIIYAPGAIPPTPRTKGPLYIRLGSPAAYDLRVAPIGLLQNFDYEAPRTWTFRDMCSRAGATAFLTPGSYDKNVGNYLVDADQTYLQVMSDACLSTFSAFGFDNLDNFFTIDLKDPSEGVDDPVYTFTVHNSRSITRQPVPGQEVPVWQVQVSSGRTWPGSTATSLTSQEKDTFTRQPWQNVFTGTSTSVKTANPGAEVAAVEIVGRDLDTPDARLAFARRYLYLFGTRRDLITLTAPFTPALLDILLHAKVRVKMPRLGCDSGRLFRVVTQSYDLRARTVTFGLWGGDPGPSDATLTSNSDTGGGSNPVEPVIPGNVILDNFVQRAWGSVVGGGGGGSVTLADFAQVSYGTVSGNPSSGDNVLHLSFDGANGGTVFTDKSPYAHTVSAIGSATTAAAAAKFGSAGLDTTPSGAGLSVPYHAVLNLRDKEFVVEGHAKNHAGSGSRVLVDFRGTSTYDVGWVIFTDNTLQRLVVYDGPTNTNNIVTPDNTLPAVGEWFHWAVERFGSTVTLYINGAFGASATYNPPNTHATGLRIAIAHDGDDNYGGAIDELLIKNVAAYQGPFVPPTAPEPDSSNPNFSYLVLQLNCGGANNSTVFTDTSPTPKTVTTQGGAKISTALVAQSGLFDGSGDYLTASHADLNMNSSDYQMQAWVYLDVPDGDTGRYTIISSYDGVQANGRWIVYRDAGNVLSFDEQDGNGANTVTTTSAGIFPLRQRVHVAASKSGTTMRLFINGTLAATSTTFTRTGFTNNLLVGAFEPSYAPNAWYWDGYIGPIELYKGLVTYTEDFTPPGYFPEYGPTGTQVTIVAYAEQAAAPGDLTIPSHNANDLIVLFLRSNTSTPPATPSGWTSRAVSNVTVGKGWRVVSQTDTSNTVSSVAQAVAHQMAAVIARNADVGTVSVNSGEGIGTLATLPTNVMLGTSSKILAGISIDQGTTVSTPALMTQQGTNESPALGGGTWAIWTTTTTETSLYSFSGRKTNLGATSYYQAWALELLKK